MPMNAVVAQSGGPTSVINNSVRGVVDALGSSPRIGSVYGASMGILGVLRNEFFDLAAQDPEQIRLLAQTPSAGSIGSCRYKLAAKEATVNPLCISPILGERSGFPSPRWGGSGWG